MVTVVKPKRLQVQQKAVQWSFIADKEDNVRNDHQRHNEQPDDFLEDFFVEAARPGSQDSRRLLISLTMDRDLLGIEILTFQHWFVLEKPFVFDQEQMVLQLVRQLDFVDVVFVKVVHDLDEVLAPLDVVQAFVLVDFCED